MCTPSWVLNTLCISSPSQWLFVVAGCPLGTRVKSKDQKAKQRSDSYCWWPQNSDVRLFQIRTWASSVGPPFHFMGRSPCESPSYLKDNAYFLSHAVSPLLEDFIQNSVCLYSVGGCFLLPFDMSLPPYLSLQLLIRELEQGDFSAQLKTCITFSSYFCLSF